MNLFSYALLIILSVFVIRSLAKNVKHGLMLYLILTTFYVLILWLTGWGLFGKSWNIVFAFVLLFVAFIKKTEDVKRNMKLNSLDVVFIVTLFYGLFELISTYIFIESFQVTIVGFRKYYLGAVIYFVTRFVLTKKDSVKPILSVFFTLVLLVSIEVILETILFNLGILNPVDLPWRSDLPEDTAPFYGQGGVFLHTFGGGYLRPGGILGSIPHTGNFIAAGMLLAFPFVLRSISLPVLNTSKTTYIYFSVALIALFSTSARQVIIPTFVIFMFYMMTSPVKFSFKFVLPAGAAIALFRFLGVFESWYASFLRVAEKKDFLYTAEAWDVIGLVRHFASLDIISAIKTFLWGQGFVPPGYVVEVLKGTADYYYTSSEVGIILMFSEVGIVGVILFILQHILAIKAGLRTAKTETDRSLGNLLHGLLLAVVVIAFSSSIHYFSLATPGVQAIHFIMLGTISGFYEMRSIHKVQDHE